MSTSSGQKAETIAAEYLVREGFRILQQNWKIPQAEIDIVASRQSCLYFVEVKYRSSPAQGSGLEYVHRRKLRHMHRAALLWMQRHQWAGEYQLAALGVAADYVVEAFVEVFE